ncbi:MAG: thrombospondin type 3 repeat-containing protein [Myxococcota bacterium]
MLLFTTLTIGCLAEVEVDVDPDGDGLTDAEEAELGTDRVTADSDGDGFDDGDELDQNTDPTDDLDKPYDLCRDDIVGTGGEVGDVAEDFELTNQWDGATRLYNYCDHVALLVFAAVW